MIVLLKLTTPREEFERITAMLLTDGCEIRETESTGYRIVFADRHWPEPPNDLISQLKASEWVEGVIHAGTPVPLIAARKSRRVFVGDIAFGDGELHLIAGPCTIESEETLLDTARAVKAAGAVMIRGGAFKPTTSPYSYGGQGDEGIKLLSSVGKQTGLGVVTEVMDPRKVEFVAAHADLLQIGARSMQNFDLLKEVGRQQKPVLLKRAMGAKVDEWLSAAEYVAKEGNLNIILCERGIRTFETGTRATLDVASPAIVKSRTMLPVVVDPSHAAGERALVLPLALAAAAAGADGLLVEVHPRPSEAVKDGAQTISRQAFAELARVSKEVHQVATGSLTRSC